MATVRYFWHGFIHRGTTFMYLQYSRPLIYHIFLNVWNTSYTISASIFVDVPCWPSYSTDKLISCIVPGSSQWFFHFAEELVISWTHIGWVLWIFQNLPLPAAQQVRDSSGVTPCIVMTNDGVLYQVPFSPESMRLRSLRQSEKKNTARDPVQQKRRTYHAIGRSIRNINKDGRTNGVRRLPNIWQKVINKGAAILKVHKCCIPANKAMSKIWNCCHYFF